MRPTIAWPHAPTHQLSNRGTYFVTAGTYLKAHYFYAPQRLEFCTAACLASRATSPGILKLGPLFSNQYHFVARKRRGTGALQNASAKRALDLPATFWSAALTV
jgi:hypothetical protein